MYRIDYKGRKDKCWYSLPTAYDDRKYATERMVSMADTFDAFQYRLSWVDEPDKHWTDIGISDIALKVLLIVLKNATHYNSKWKQDVIAKARELSNSDRYINLLMMKADIDDSERIYIHEYKKHS